jgi:hypothetical protein
MTGEHMARHASGGQRELFALLGSTSSWAPEAKRELLSLIETLLLEATTDKATAREAGDEQDHA